MKKEERKKTIDEWKAKGLDWCAEQLWIWRNKADERKREIEKFEFEKWCKKSEYECDCDLLKDANQTLKCVLEDYGIRPTRYTITYIACCQDSCEELYPECDNCYSMKTYMKDISLYSFVIEEDFMTAVNAMFEEVEYDVLKVVNNTTGQVIYEYKEDEEEDEEE